MTVDDLIRELSALDPIDRSLPVYPVGLIAVFPGRAVVLTERIAARFRTSPNPKTTHD